MPLIDMAEAVSRGDIIVDEVDALNKYAQRLLSDRTQAPQAQRLPNLPMPSAFANAASGDAGSEGFDWNRVLVDEVEIVRAAEHGRLGVDAANVAAVDAERAGPAPNGGEAAPQPEEGDLSPWNRSLIVDEIDFIEAVEQGEIIGENSGIMRLSYDSRIHRTSDNTENEPIAVELSSAESDDEERVAND